MNNDLQTWNQGASAYLEVASEESDLFKREVDTPTFISLLGDIKGKSILDIGCGIWVHLLLDLMVLKI